MSTLPKKRLYPIALGLVALILVTGCGLARQAASRSNPNTAPSASVTPSGTPAASPSSVASPANGKLVPAPGTVFLGAYLDQSGMSQRQSESLRRQELGRNYRIIHWFYEWEDDLPSTFDLPAGTVPMLSWKGTSYNIINSGSQDRLIAAAAKALARYGKPVFLRWAWEMNGSWYVWGGSRNGNNPAAFITAWRRLHGIFAANGASNVIWVWGPNWYSVPASGWNTLAAYYPGDQYVDWIAVSGYSDGRQTPEDLFGSFYRQFSSHRPLMIAETSAADKGGSVKADWINLLRSWVIGHPAIRAVVWWDTDVTPGTAENFSIDSNRSALAAFKQLANDPYFSG